MFKILTKGSNTNFFQEEANGVEYTVKDEDFKAGMQISKKSRLQAAASERSSKTNNVQKRNKSTKKAFTEERKDQNVPELHINDIEPPDIKVYSI